MEKYLNKGIKEVITEFPEIEQLLNEFNIGCVSCSVGTCLLKDIVEIHNLSSDEERLLIQCIARIIYGGEEVDIPIISRKPQPTVKMSYSPPMKKLVDEHVVIKRFLAVLPALIENLEVDTSDGKRLVLDCVDFIRLFADRYHHAKEEEILFPYFNQKLEIISTMLEDHNHARAHVREIIVATEKCDRKSVQDHLKAYGELLSGHIKREDEILYPWMDRNLSMTQIGTLFSQFNETDKQFGDAPRRYMEFVDSLEKQLLNKEVVS